MSVYHYDRLVSFINYFDRCKSNLDKTKKVNEDSQKRLINQVASSIFLIEKERNCMPNWDRSQSKQIKIRLELCDGAVHKLQDISRKISSKASDSKVKTIKNDLELIFEYFYACLECFRSGVPFDHTDLADIEGIIGQLDYELGKINEKDKYYLGLSEIRRRISNFKDRLQDSSEFVERYSEDIDALNNDENREIPVDLEPSSVIAESTDLEEEPVLREDASISIPAAVESPINPRPSSVADRSTGLVEKPVSQKDIPSIINSFETSLKKLNQKRSYAELESEIRELDNQIKKYNDLMQQFPLSVEQLANAIRMLDAVKSNLNKCKRKLDSKFLFIKSVDQFIIEDNGRVRISKKGSFFARIKLILNQLFSNRDLS